MPTKPTKSGMANMIRISAIVILCLLIVSCIVIGQSSSEVTTSNPSVPEFALKVVDAYYVEVHIRITNQPFTQYVDTNTHKSIGLYYQVQTKGHDSKDWKTIEEWIGEAGSYNPRTPYKEQDYTAQYTILKYYDSGNLPREGLIDFRVQALIGFPEIYHTSDHLDLYNTWASFSFNGTYSDWSNIQTVNLKTDAVPEYNSQDTWVTPSALPEPPESGSTEPTNPPTTEPTVSITVNPSQVPLDSFIEATTIILTAIIIALIVIVLMLLFIYRKINRVSACSGNDKTPFSL